MLFPFDRGWRLGADVVNDTIDSADGIDDACGDASEHIPGEVEPVSRHEVFRLHGSHRSGVFVGAVIPHDAHRLDRQQHNKSLLNLSVQTCGVQFFDQDGVRFAQDSEAIRFNGTEAANSQSGAWEGVSPDHFFGKPKFCAHPPNLVLEQVPQGFDQFKSQLCRQSTHVVVRLDGGSRSVRVGATFDDIGVQGSLCQKAGIGDGPGFFPKDVDEGLADDFALSLRIGDTGQF